MIKSKINQDISRITVSIEIHAENSKNYGTGFIVLPNRNSKYAYLFTAQHVVLGKDLFAHHRIDFNTRCLALGSSDPTQVDPTQVDPTQVDPTQVDPTQVDPTQVDPTQVDPTQVDPTQVDPTQVDPTQVDPTQVDPTQVDPRASRLVHSYPDHKLKVLEEKNYTILLKNKKIKIMEDTFYFPTIIDDFSFAIIDLDYNQIENLPLLTISNYDLLPIVNPQYKTLGYPTVAQGQEEFLGLVDPYEPSVKEPYFIQKIGIKSTVPIGNVREEDLGTDITTKLSGLSGSGVFFTDRNDLHLTGLIIEATSIQTIFFLDFYSIVAYVNDFILNKNIFLDNNIIPFLETNSQFTIGNDIIKLDNINNEDLMKHIASIGSPDEKQIAELKKNKNNPKTTKMEIDKQLVELAKNCVYIGAQYNNEKKYNLATTYFNYAISINEIYSIALLKARSDRKKGDNTESILNTSNSILDNFYKSPLEKYRAYKDKVSILEESEKNIEIYESICGFLNLIQSESNLKKLDENLPKEYVYKCKIIINNETASFIKNGKKQDLNPYLYMSELCKKLSLYEESLYFLICAKELLKISDLKDRNTSSVENINILIKEIISQGKVSSDVIFTAQSEVENDLTFFEKLKDDFNNSIHEDLQIIIDKINNIYSKSNNTGILKQIDENIRLLIERKPTDNTDLPANYEHMPSNDSSLTLSHENPSPSAPVPSKSRMLRSLLLCVTLYLSTPFILSGSTTHPFL